MTAGTRTPTGPSAVVLYHYFHPDDVVSSLHFSELCSGLRERGWDITALPCNRGCRDETRTYPSHEVWNGIRIDRVWRPRFAQASAFGRIANLIWMIAAWSLAAFHHKPDVLIVGTDPILSLLAALPWKLIRPRTRIVHWCFDLYPEAAIADGLLSANSRITRLTKRLMRSAYARCSLLIDIGICMRRRLQQYQPSARFATLTPWALAEPPQPAAIDPTERTELFGPANLALLYSGNFGRAHAYERTFALARCLRGESVSLVFSVRGNAQASLQSSLTAEDRNISLAEFAPQEKLEARLSAADIHVVSLREEWTGTVVPSKFFGALAVGRPVLFEGSPDCAIAGWIKRFQVGWVLSAPARRNRSRRNSLS